MRSRAARALRKPPHVVLRRVAQEARVRLERAAAPRRAQRLTEQALLAKLGATDVGDLWARLAASPALLGADVHQVASDERSRILRAAEDAVGRRVDLLGSGPTELGTPVDWLCDFKTGRRWEPAYARQIEYANLDQPSDVKVPWELSRMQWLIPAAQAYVLTGDERYAIAARALIEEWIEANPYAYTVNWSCTMDVALRAMTWTFLFHSLHASGAWADPAFRSRFLRSLYLHGDFTARNLEWSDINGNHYTADAAGLVFIGLFFGQGAEPGRWHEDGWNILLDELPRQVTPDGVDFELSTAYHRLVTELFLLPALLRRQFGLEVPAWYLERLEAMARFAAAYTRPDGSSPAWGDADDARALPLGGQALGDHRYLGATMAAAWGAAVPVSGPRDEVAWLLGTVAAAALEDTPPPASTLFPNGGVAILRARDDHVFVDCGPVGLAGRGGHGHNDITSVDAMLDGVPVLLDPGTFTYTGSPEWRNRFRSTAAHDVVQVDGEELNRLGPLHHLWSLSDDARPVGPVLAVADELHTFRVGHTGYRRLPDPVEITRTVQLDVERHGLLVLDDVTARTEHELAACLTFPPGAAVALHEGGATLATGDRTFDVRWEGWNAGVGTGWFSPSYGVKIEVPTLTLRARSMGGRLAFAVAPTGIADLRAWLLDVVTAA